MLDSSRLGARRLLLTRLQAIGAAPGDVTHLHHDQCENWPMFPRATLNVDAAEIDWACAEPIGAPLIPEYAVRELARSPRLNRLPEGPTGLPGVTCFEAPGHFPHHLVFVLDGEPTTIFSAEVAKNHAELAPARPTRRWTAPRTPHPSGGCEPPGGNGPAP